ncbi:uncharacterized protein LOC141537134 [Cotesia typhae]|uniref:uncharacterized protein LOC141537134 n=1 Tax=Cotesia typhae TaxID=2053667 RepID=UPI003D695E82
MIWRHDSEDINFDSPRGGISLVTEKGRETSSRLMIQNAVPADSGLYTCKPSNANPGSIRVHVVKDEHPAAMYHGNGNNVYSKIESMYLIFVISANIILM